MYELIKHLDMRASNLHQRIITSKIATSEQIKGCSEAEIKKIEQTYNLFLPYSYKVFLRHFGRCMYNVATDLEFLYPEVLSFNQYVRDIEREMQEQGDFSPEELLPDNAFIFAMKYKMESYYFITGEGIEDPAIFYDEGDGNVTKVQESIFDFWEEEVKFKEKLITQQK